jgi:DNA-binding MarR family transcriptional regulator
MTALHALAMARKHGVSPSSLHVLLVAIDDSPITPTRISKMTGMTTAATTGTCDILARNGWINRCNNPHDRRSWLVVPTERAFEIFTVALDDP